MKNKDNFGKIHVLNRAQLVDDARALADMSLLRLDVFLNLTDYLSQEKDYIAWYPGYRALSWLKTKLINTEYYESFKVRNFKILNKSNLLFSII